MDSQRFNVEIRSAIEGSKLSGHAAIFEQVALIGGSYYEQLSRSAFDEVLKTSDARFLVNHDPSMILGRQGSGTLRMAADSTGLAFEVDLPNTSLGNDIRELVARGDLNEGSFGFIPGAIERSTAPDGKQMRTHTQIRELLDASLVTYPAYDGTSIYLRSIDIKPVSTSSRSRLLRARLLAHQIQALKGGV